MSDSAGHIVVTTHSDVKAQAPRSMGKTWAARTRGAAAGKRIAKKKKAKKKKKPALNLY